MSKPAVDHRHDRTSSACFSAQSGYGKVQVLWGIDLDVAASEIVCVIGSNGAGKSTLLRTISGLVPAWKGQIVMDGRDLTRATPAQVLAAGVAHVPEGRRLFSVMSVDDNLRMGAYLRNRRSRCPP